MKRKLKILAKIVCFCLIFVLLLDFVNGLFKPKWLEDRWASSKTNVSFYKLEKNSTDVLFFGSSVVAASADPFQLYNEYGISSYNLSVVSQTMSGTYFWVKEALQTQKPKVIFVEVKTLGRKHDKLESKARKSYDYMRLGKTKLEYAYATVNSDKETKDNEEAQGIFEYLFPLSLYHTRWSELDYDDYDFVLGNNNSDTKGYAALTNTFKYTSKYDKASDDAGKYDGFDAKKVKYSKYNATNKEYVEKIAKLAKQNNVELILYKTPDTSWSVKKYNYVNDLAKELGVKYLDFNLKSMRKVVGINFAEDGADNIHMNISGGKKVTSYIGKYLTKNFNLTNYKEKDSSVTKSFQWEMATYKTQMKNAKLLKEMNLNNYLKLINDKDYAFIVVAGSSSHKLNFSTEQLDFFKDMNIKIDKFQKDSVYGNNLVYVSEDVKSDASINISKEEDKYTTAVIDQGGQFSDGMSYSAKVSGGLCSVRVNNNACGDVYEDAMNIVVYDKKTKSVIDTVSLKNNAYGTVSIGRKGKG